MYDIYLVGCAVALITTLVRMLVVKFVLHAKQLPCSINWKLPSRITGYIFVFVISITLSWLTVIVDELVILCAVSKYIRKLVNGNIKNS